MSFATAEEKRRICLGRRIVVFSAVGSGDISCSGPIYSGAISIRLRRKWDNGFDDNWGLGEGFPRHIAL